VQAKSIGGGRRRRFRVVAICERDDDLRTVRITITVHTTICQRTIHGLSNRRFVMQLMAKRYPWIPACLIFSDVSELKDSWLLPFMRIDVVTAGFPCQGVSVCNSYSRQGFQSEVWIGQRPFWLASCSQCENQCSVASLLLMCRVLEHSLS
jgi:site-specific DNA-cytosine methylase